jgi:hypothetical protein
MTFRGVTLDQYDAVITRMGYEPDGAGHENGRYHWVAKTDDGIRVVDVWDSRETFGAFAESTMGPITASLGVPQPELVFYDIHNTLVGPRYLAATAG